LTNYSNPNNWKKTNLIPKNSFDECVAALFGVGVSSTVNGVTVNVCATSSQIFDTHEFEELILGLKMVSYWFGFYCNQLRRIFLWFPTRKMDVTF